MGFKIYTKKGDKGFTALFGGSKVEKDDIRVEAYGTVDELNAHIGLLADKLDSDLLKADLSRIQYNLFNVGSHLASTPEMSDQLPPIEKNLVSWMEQEMDKMDESLPDLKNFILPGGHPVVSQCHIVRTVCRRAERRVISAKESLSDPSDIIQMLNRLSDYFFMLSRRLSQEYGVDEKLWKSK
ncbi:MAG TPA: cob(I)yrinic acid a,c-diamide adenosyltransferase [Saprospiraceae bacterium]|nr:cob(I)yrinic acid a,c-diamide adenosyltransferase [Saprospiraceae bacterium]